MERKIVNIVNRITFVLAVVGLIERIANYVMFIRTIHKRRNQKKDFGFKSNVQKVGRTKNDKRHRTIH